MERLSSMLRGGGLKTQCFKRSKREAVHTAMRSTVEAIYGSYLRTLSVLFHSTRRKKGIDSTMIVPFSAGPDSSGLVAKNHKGHHGWWWSVIVGVVWTVFAALHVLPLLYFSLSAYAYWILQNSGVSYFLSAYHIGIESTHYRSISLAYASVAFLHLWFLLRMTTFSIQMRKFAFIDPLRFRRDTASSGILRSIARVAVEIFSPTGLLGVSGPWFDLVLLVREMLETLLQTVQAYRMSLCLSHASLNRLYVGLLVLNCWMMALVHSIFHRSEVTRYFVSLLCDLVLDIASSMGVPFALAVSYSKDADTNSPSFFGLKWLEDTWLANATSEFQLILVTSWGDLASKLVFAVGMIGTQNTLKRFVGTLLDETGESDWRQRWNFIVPDPKFASMERMSSRTLIALKKSSDAVKSHPVLTKLLKLMFAVWGTAVLVLHVEAESNPKIPGCVMQVWPWGVKQPSCKMMLINCYSDGIAGDEGEIRTRLEPVYPISMAEIAIRHCPSLEIPSIIQSYASLNIIKIYNSTITKWDLDAALTKTNHPIISIVMLTRVKTPNGTLPLGLQSGDFPPTIFVLGFIVTNMRELPDDIDSKRPPRAIIHFDTANFKTIPAVLLRLAPRIIILAANPLDEVPVAMFELPGIETIDLRDTLITELPADVMDPSVKLTNINLDGTNITSFPPWIDEWLTFPGDVFFPERISAAGSPYCADRERIFAGEQSAFSASSSSRLLDASVDNWDYLKHGVSCTPTAMYRYPLPLEDFFNHVA